MTELLNSPFNLDNEDLYCQWRDQKLESVPQALTELVVEVGDPRRLTRAELIKMEGVIQRTNMVIYAGQTGEDNDKEIPRRVAVQFGLSHLNNNWLADDDGITSLCVQQEGDRPLYIPYSNRPIKWHTDGYYNPLDRQCHAVLLHCVRSAGNGGENGLIDHELVYIHLRDHNPDYIRALMHDKAMLIPAGTDMNGNPRPRSDGPVFMVQANGALHMRYTERKRNIEWADDPLTRAAVKALADYLNSDSASIFRTTLQPGMGLLSNNVLHDRTGFDSGEDLSRRLLYRARYFDRITCPAN